MTTPTEPTASNPFAPKDTSETNGLRNRNASISFSRTSSWNDRRPLPERRTSSFVSDAPSDGRRFSVKGLADSLAGDSAQDEAESLNSSQEASLWYSLPLLFAIVPAIGGVAFKSGATILTDLALLCLAAVYLNWCLTSPWAWYYSTQAVVRRKPSEMPGAEEVLSQEEPGNEDNTSGQEASSNDNNDLTEQDLAAKELRAYEVLALSFCFLGPILGAYILHLARASLHRISDDLITNLHLTLFVLLAEMRPVRHCMKMVYARTIYLQRVVREDKSSEEKVAPTTMKEMMDRISELETSLADAPASGLGSPDASMHQASAEIMKKTQLALQTQIDALNRAVRRYEKRATAQTIQTEARLQDLEARLKDALSLAAAAATYSQQPGSVSLILEWISWAAVLPMQAGFAAAIYPLRTVSALIRSFLVNLRLVRPAVPPRPTGKLPPYGQSYPKLGKDRVYAKSSLRNGS